jgi:hypothetical protein
MYANGKLRHVETMPGTEGEGTSKNDGEGEFSYDIL